MSVVQRWADTGLAKGHHAGFSLLELVIVISLILLLFLAVWWRLLPLRGDAEAAHVATTIGTLRSALGLEVAERIVKRSLERDSFGSIAGLDRSNPMPLLGQAPGNYIGEVNSSQSATIQPGSWYYHPPSHQLRYRVHFPRYLSRAPETDRPVELAWVVRLRYVDHNESGSYHAPTDALRGVALEALNNPQWAIAGENAPAALEAP